MFDAAQTLRAFWLLFALVLQAQACVPKQYPVQPGDYLCNITNHFDVSADAILTANSAYPGGVLVNATKDSLKSGITLTLPCPSTPCCPSWKYAAHSDESFFSISRKFGVDFDALRLANNVNISDPDCCSISCGDAIVIPCLAGQPTCEPATSSLPPAIPPAPAVPLPPPTPAAQPIVQPPFTPVKYQIIIPTVTSNKISSPHSDSAYFWMTCRVNGVHSSSSPIVSGEYDMHGGTTRHRYPQCIATATSPDDVITLGFAIVNAGDKDHLPQIIQASIPIIDAALTATGESVWVPVVDATKGLVPIIFPNCDGLVAADGVIFTPSNYTNFVAKTTGHFSRSYPSEHCGHSSAYTVDWEIDVK